MVAQNSALGHLSDLSDVEDESPGPTVQSYDGDNIFDLDPVSAVTSFMVCAENVHRTQTLETDDPADMVERPSKRAKVDASQSRRASKFASGMRKKR